MVQPPQQPSEPTIQPVECKTVREACSRPREEPPQTVTTTPSKQGMEATPTGGEPTAELAQERGLEDGELESDEQARDIIQQLRNSPRREDQELLGQMKDAKRENPRYYKQIVQMETGDTPASFSTRKRSLKKKSEDSDEPDVIKTRTEDDEKRTLVLGKFRYDISKKRNNDRRRSMASQRKVTEEEVFLYYVQTNYNRLEGFDSAMSESNWQRMMAYLLHKYAGSKSEVCADADTVPNTFLIPQAIQDRWEEFEKKAWG